MKKEQIKSLRVLTLCDLKGLSQTDLRKHVLEYYKACSRRFKFIVAYESEGNWGCDSSSFFILVDLDSGQLFENHASHCSCYGFDGQFNPEPTALTYLLSTKFYFCTGGYDNGFETYKEQVQQHVAKIKKG